MKYALIATYRLEFPVATMCALLEVSRSGFYASVKRPLSKHDNEDLALRLAIVELHATQRRALGAVKTWRQLNTNNIRCGKHRVARLRKLEGIVALRKARFRVMHVHQHTEPAAPDLVKRAFKPSVPNKVWVSDMTTINTREGWVHVAIVLDLFARRVVGWAIDKTQAATLPIAALQMAIDDRKPNAGLICHTDQGSVYGSTEYRNILTAHALRPSMSRRGNCHDNAVAESFFSNLKNELTHHIIYDTRAEAKAEIEDYISVYYNCERPHQTLNYRTPAAAEASYKVLH